MAPDDLERAEQDLPGLVVTTTEARDGHDWVSGTGPKVLEEGDVEGMGRGPSPHTIIGVVIVLIIGGLEAAKIFRGEPMAWWDYGLLGFCALALLSTIAEPFRKGLAQAKLGGELDVTVSEGSTEDALQCSVELPLAVGERKINSITASLGVFGVTMVVRQTSNGSSSMPEVHDLYSETVELTPSLENDNLYQGAIEIPRDQPTSHEGERSFVVWQLDLHVDIHHWPDWHEVVPLWAEQDEPIWTESEEDDDEE